MPAPQTPARPPESDGATLSDSIRLLLQDLPGLVSDRVQLFSLELQRAGRALARIVALVSAAAILACTAWLALWVGIALALIDAGVPRGGVVTLIAAVNFATALAALLRARSLVHWLSLPATVRRLTVSPSARDGQGDAAGTERPAPVAAADVPASQLVQESSHERPGTPLQHAGARF